MECVTPDTLPSSAAHTPQAMLKPENLRIPGKQCHASEKRLCCLLLGKRSLFHMHRPTELQPHPPVWRPPGALGHYALQICLSICRSVDRSNPKVFKGRGTQITLGGSPRPPITSPVFKTS